MILRPASASWFELLVPREELALALRSLAATGQVELQAHTDMSAAHLLPALRAVLDDFKRLAQQFAQYWPVPAPLPIEHAREPEQIAQSALRVLQAWTAAAGPFIDRLQQLHHERRELEPLQGLLSQAITLPDLHQLAGEGGLLAHRLYLLDPAARPLGIPPSVLVQQVACPEGVYLLALGAKEQMAILDSRADDARARRLVLPLSLPAGREAALAWTTARLRDIRQESLSLATQLGQVSDAHALSGAIADLQFTEWLASQVPALPMTEHFAWITGWTSDASASHVRAALEQAHVRHLLRFPEPPPGLIGPVLLRNPRWARQFEIFARLLGMPATSEADPSLIVALIAPLMFGFMFGDVGHGAVILLAGILLRRRIPAVALLIPGGAVSILFGFLFGSIFTREDLLPALWLRPLEHPLALFGASLAFGAAVILTGLVLDALQHHWTRRGRQWWSTRGGLLLCYLALVMSVIDARMLWAAAAGLAWSWLGGGVKRLAAGIGASIETLLQLLVNTVSFVRVGAFALAHAGLAAAIVGLAAATGSRFAYWTVLLLGNVLVIVIEGLVVAIQTTRLVLFEFFVRFLRGAGRPFRPLSLPSAATKQA